jgi:hypothetical protein
MPKLADLIASEVRKPGGACTIGRLLTTLGKGDAADLADALATRPSRRRRSPAHSPP